MKILKKYIKPYLLSVLLAPLFMFLEVFMDLMQPTLMARIIDDGIMQSNQSILIHTGLLMLGLTIIGLLGGIGCTIASTFASTGVARDLRENLYAKVLSLSHRNIDNLETGSIITRLTNDVIQVESLVRFGLRIMVRAPLQILGSLILAFIISPALSAIFLVLIPLIVITIVLIMKLSAPLFAQVQSKMDRLNICLQENLAGIRLVKAFGRQKYEKKKFRKANDEWVGKNIRASRILAFANPLLMTFLNAGILAVIWFGSGRVWSENLEIGKIIAFINYMMQLSMSLIMVSHILISVSRARASLSRLEELFDTSADIVENTHPIEDKTIEGAIEFRDVTFSYSSKSEEPVLRDLSFSVSPGEKVAILGATGSGKSTLASLIPRLYDVSSGSILLDGTDIREFSLSLLRSHIGMAPQQTVLFSGSIQDNIRYGKKDFDGAPEEYAETASIRDYIESQPEGYNSEVKKRGTNLSGGQKQRIAIARALWGDPSIVILDDSTSAVDMKTAEKIQSALYEQKKSTVFIITQRISSAIQADRIMLLEAGEIAGMGTHEELIQSNRIYQEIYRSQTQDEVKIS
jgi:ATP-binding cassette subfamily B protein